MPFYNNINNGKNSYRIFQTKNNIQYGENLIGNKKIYKQ